MHQLEKGYIVPIAGAAPLGQSVIPVSRILMSVSLADCRSGMVIVTDTHLVASQQHDPHSPLLLLTQLQQCSHNDDHNNNNNDDDDDDDDVM